MAFRRLISWFTVIVSLTFEVTVLFNDVNGIVLVLAQWGSAEVVLTFVFSQLHALEKK